MGNTLPNAHAQLCKSCEMGTLVQSRAQDEFTYGEGNDAVRLAVEVPVWTCNSCGDSFTDAAAEELRHDEICRHLRRLTPRQIQLERKKHQLSQDALSRLTGIGIASIKRWEGGNQIQNASTDRYLRLIFSSERILSALESLAEQTQPADAPIFVTDRPSIVCGQAGHFKLRMAA